jgi:hypothetical protein
MQNSVFEAIDTTLNAGCALKEIAPYPGTGETALPQLREQFRRENLDKTNNDAGRENRVYQKR